jgi:hypothetical protein
VQHDGVALVTMGEALDCGDGLHVFSPSSELSYISW